MRVRATMWTWLCYYILPFRIPLCGQSIATESRDDRTTSDGRGTLIINSPCLEGVENFFEVLRYRCSWHIRRFESCFNPSKLQRMLQVYLTSLSRNPVQHGLSFQNSEIAFYYYEYEILFVMVLFYLVTVLNCYGYRSPCFEYVQHTICTDIDVPQKLVHVICRMRSRFIALLQSHDSDSQIRLQVAGLSLPYRNCLSDVRHQFDKFTVRTVHSRCNSFQCQYRHETKYGNPVSRSSRLIAAYYDTCRSRLSGSRFKSMTIFAGTTNANGWDRVPEEAWRCPVDVVGTVVVSDLLTTNQGRVCSRSNQQLTCAQRGCRSLLRTICARQYQMRGGR